MKRPVDEPIQKGIAEQDVDDENVGSGVSQGYEEWRVLVYQGVLTLIWTNGTLQLYNQDLAGFFTSIDQPRFIGAWHMVLDPLRPHMDVSDNEVFSVYPGRFNNPGDLIKGRAFRCLNVTRKILIKDIPSLITTALNMQTFCLGRRCVSQLRGSPMGNPLSPALCLMVVSIREQIWATNFKSMSQ